MLIVRAHIFHLKVISIIQCNFDSLHKTFQENRHKMNEMKKKFSTYYLLYFNF